MTFGQRLKIVNKTFRFTQQEFSGKLGVSKTILNKYYKDIAKPGVEVLVRLNKHFPGINLEWLITGKGEMFKPGFEYTMLDKNSEKGNVVYKENPDLKELVKDSLNSYNFDALIKAKDEEIKALKEVISAHKLLIEQLKK